MSDQQINQLIIRPLTAIRITTEQQEGQESANLIALRKARKDGEAQLEEIKRPFMESIDKLEKDLNQLTKPISDRIAQIKNIEAATNNEILRWRRELKMKADQAQAEQDRLRREQERLQCEKEAAARRANQPPPAPLPPPAPVIQPARGWETSQGQLQTRKVPKFRIVDESLVPLEMEVDGQLVRFWNIDEVAVGKIRRSYGEKPSPIPGIEFYYDEGLSVK